MNASDNRDEMSHKEIEMKWFHGKTHGTPIDRR